MSSQEDNYNLTTNGSCFICLYAVDSFYHKEFASLNNLVKYLRIEEEIFGNELKVNEVKVEVCSRCEKNLKEFSQLYQLLEKTKIKMGYLLTTFQELIGESDADLEVTEEFIKGMGNSSECLQLVKRARELINNKCAEKSSFGKAQVILPKLPVIKQEFGVEDNPLDPDYVPTSDEESEESQSMPIPSNSECEDPLSLQSKFDQRPSKYAKYFTKIKSIDGTDFECNICKKVFKSLDTVTQHLKRKHRDSLVKETEIKTECGIDSDDATEDNGHKCTIPGCTKRGFKSKKALYRHLTMSHKLPKVSAYNSVYSDKCSEVETPEGKMVQCNNCQKTWKNLSTFLDHYRNVHAPKIFKCSECSWAFSKKRNLTVHWKRQHGKGVKIENEATSGTKRKSKYEGKFTKTALSGKQVFECNECRRRCNLFGDFITHFNNVHAPKKFKCDDCGKAFHAKPNLARHLRQVHSKIKN